MFFEPSLTSLFNLSTASLAVNFFQAEKRSIIQFLEMATNNDDNDDYDVLNDFLHCGPYDGMFNFDQEYIFSATQMKKVDSYPLPETLKTKLKNAILYMDKDLSDWTLNNIELLGRNAKQFPRALQWTRRGKIDVAKTVDNLLKDENINVDDRFLLSCRFCCATQVTSLWDRFSDGARLRFVDQLDEESIVWMHHLRDKIPVPINPIAVPCESTYKCLVDQAFENNNIQAVRYFWDRLSLSTKMDALSSNYNPTYEFYEFYLSQPEELSRDEFLETNASDILKTLLNNWLWHEDFFLHLDSYKQFLSEFDIVELFNVILDKIDSYHSTGDLQNMVCQFWRLHSSTLLLREGHFIDIVDKLNVKDDPSWIALTIQELTVDQVKEFLESDPYVINNLIEKDQSNVLDKLIKILCQTDEEVIKFKINYLTRIEDSLCLQVLERGDLENFLKIKAWASVPEDVWQVFKTEVLLNEDDFHLFRDLFIDGGASKLLEYLQILFPSKEDLAVYKQEVFIPRLAGDIFIYSLPTMCDPLLQDFLNFCFSTEEEKKSFKKRILFEKGELVVFLLSEQYNNSYRLDEILEFCSLTVTEKREFKARYNNIPSM